MARLLADENFPLPVVEELRHLGHDVVTTLQAGLANQQTPDDLLLASATSDSRSVLTLNRRHFVRLHNSGTKHAGIIVCTFDPDFVSQARRIDEALRSRIELKGRLIRVNRPST
jgi:predicted nuclease of predicted toxin-antitoxin system